MIAGQRVAPDPKALARNLATAIRGGREQTPLKAEHDSRSSPACRAALFASCENFRMAPKSHIENKELPPVPMRKFRMTPVGLYT